MKTQTSLLLFVCLLLTRNFFANAQKLPNKQETGIYAPVDLKIDGSAKEWQDNFQAYNHATEVFYTIANDANHFYVIFRAADGAVIQKIITGGITFSISSVEKKSATPPVVVTYPVVPFVHALVKYALRPPSPLSDSAVLAVNKQINDFMKEIKISGVKTIPDSSVSVYNDQDIRAAQHIDNKKTYTYELALPLTFIKPLINDKGTFAYRVQVTGIDLKTTKVISGHASGDPAPPSEDAVPHGMEYDITPTYFSAEYTLAKKP